MVIHAISLPPGKFGTGRVVDFFTNVLDPKADPYFAAIATLRVSAHYFIERRGRLIRFVAEDMRAWHAGVSCFADRHNCNDFSLGIELEGDDIQPFTEPQYEVLIELLRDLRGRYPGLTADRIVGHCHIAPERKTDPGPHFAWERVRRGLA